eukprot:2357212-Rhodomonas_salina.3
MGISDRGRGRLVMSKEGASWHDGLPESLWSYQTKGTVCFLPVGGRLGSRQRILKFSDGGACFENCEI